MEEEVLATKEGGKEKGGGGQPTIKSASCSIPGGSFRALKSAYGTRRYWAWPPR